MSDQSSADTFAAMGNTYQEKVVQAILQDPLFAEQMTDLLNPKFFELKYLESIVGAVFKHKQLHKTFPSPELVEIMVGEDEDNDLLVKQVKDFMARHRAHPLNGDTGFVQAHSLDFCKRQALKEAMVKAIDKIEENDYDSIQSIIRNALNKGATRDLGHEYMEGFAARSVKSIRKPIPTPWSNVDKELNGGCER